MNEEQFNRLYDLLAKGLGAMNNHLASIGDTHKQLNSQLQQFLIAANPAPNYQKPLAEYWGFDWDSIGATPQSFDEEGATSVEWNGRLFTRRSPQNKFQEAVWFSRAVGKDSEGNNRYEKLITFKDTTEAEELGKKVKKAVSTTSRDQAQLKTVPAPPPPAPRTNPVSPPQTEHEIAEDLVRRTMVKAFGCASDRTWRVGPAGADAEVWKDEAGIRQCNCAGLKQKRLKDAKAECQHIIAVVLFNAQSSNDLKKARAQPSQELR